MVAKDAFSAVDTLALSLELKAMGKARFEKAYDLPNGSFLLTFKAEGREKKKLVVVPGKYAAFTDAESVEHEESPGPFSTSLRQIFGGMMLTRVDQPGGERYLEFAFERPLEEKPRLLVIEFFGGGNVIAVRDGKIVAVATPKTWAHRILRPGERYVRPPSRRDPFKLTLADVAAALSRSKTSIVTTLAARLSLGGTLAEEVVGRMGVEPGEPANLDPEGRGQEVLRALSSILAEVTEPPSGFLYSEGVTLLDFEPFPSVRWRNNPSISVDILPRFSQAAQRFFSSSAPLPPAQQSEEDERARLERLKEQQMAGIAALESMAKELREAADSILANYQDVEEHVKKILGEIPDAKEVEVDVGGRKAKIDPRRPTRDNAQRMYDSAKKQLPKLSGAKQALQKTEAALASLSESARGAGTSTASNKPKRTKHFWFEKAPRWFVTSEGIPVVGGRDAKSNDMVVKRYLKEEDRYIHADVHGAPSIVVKVAKGSEISDSSLREAGIWAVSYSKAWRAGHASADAYWVKGDQVSKAGSSGEFVPAGSWVIHGTKHVMRDLPIELAIGEVTFEGERLLVSAPPQALARAGARALWSLKPGDEKERTEVIRQLSKDMGVSMDTIQSLLPGGGVRVSRV